MKREFLDISVIIPTFNGQGSLEELYQRLANTMNGIKKSYEVIFVDDGSTDKTFEILKALYYKDKKIRVIRLSKNFGQYSAIFAGMKEMKGRAVVIMDDDLENAPEDIPKILDKIYEGYNFVSGWRKIKNKPLITRRVPSLLLNLLVSFSTGRRVRDFGCGLKAWTRELVEEFVSNREFPPPISLIGRANYIEVPISYNGQNTKSKTSLLKLIKNGIKLISGIMEEKLTLFYRIGKLCNKDRHKCRYTIKEIIC